MKKILIHNLLVAAFLLPQIAGAQAVITEIMYDPSGADSGHEWIEIYNAGTSVVPLTKWKIRTNDSNHTIVAVLGSKIFAPNSYAIIAQNVTKFQSDYPDFHGQLFHSALSLGNTDGTIELRDASSTVVEHVIYDSAQGALGDGNSLQRPIPTDDSALFSPHTPTPGAAMSSSVIPPKVSLVVPVKKTSKKSHNKGPVSSEVKPAYKKSIQSEISPLASDTSSDAGNVAVVESLSGQTAGAAQSSSLDSYWLLALVALMVAAMGAIFVAKRFKKTEWDIIEEKSEDV